jgi:hypothetical protein
MDFANPTSLRIGMSGVLAGKRYRVAGRIVMGMDDAGATYYWNEFNLVNDEGEVATLVYEESGRGGQWRLFTLFEPEFPISAQDAATKRVGDPLNLEGQEVRVTLVDESRVYHIEGEAPEGVEVGDVAHYFNAESGNTMQVVSWTGDEVECYRGVSLAGRVVAVAFNLPYESSTRPRSALAASLSALRGSDKTGENYISMRTFLLMVAGIVLIAAVAFAGYSFSSNKGNAGVRKTSAPSSSLVVGTSGKLGGQNYRIRSHAIVEIAEVGRVFDRHEYRLVDMDDAEALLVLGQKPGVKDWVLFRPLQPLKPITPVQAGALRVGQVVNLDGGVASVDEIFRSVIRRADGEESPNARSGGVLFGFGGHAGSTPLLVLWNHDGIVFFRGQTLLAQDVKTAFPRTAGN